MDYKKDFMDRKWIVKSVGESSECPLGARVIFAGDPKNVEIHCNEAMPYPAGMYAVDAKGAGKIMSDHYNIIMKVAAGPHIEFSPTGPSGSIGGSWTAEDMGSGAGGDE